VAGRATGEVPSAVVAATFAVFERATIDAWTGGCAKLPPGRWWFW
jgi:hypothetical protein